MRASTHIFFFFFFTATATTEIYTLSLHDALPILAVRCTPWLPAARCSGKSPRRPWATSQKDRKSTRLNSSHTVISYAVFCLKKKKKNKKKTKKQKKNSTNDRLIERHTETDENKRY